jgi:hypothetical protein
MRGAAMSLAGLDVSKLPHGTRGRNSSGCRCAPCRAAGAAFARARVRVVRDAAAEIEPNAGLARTKLFYRTRRDGSRYLCRGRMCPGTEGRPCVAGGAWLRSGPVCLRCVDRARVWNGLVPIDRSRRHLQLLSTAGVGYHAVAAASDVALGILAGIARGSKRRIRAATERRILSVDEGARADGSLVLAAPSWALLSDLEARGFTRRWISAELGYVHYAPFYSCGRPKEWMLARNALAIEKLHRRVLAKDIAPPSPFVDAAPTYRILRELLERVSSRALSRLLGYTITKSTPQRVRLSTAERVRAFAAELERRRVEGEPLDAIEGNVFARAFGSRYEGGGQWQWERRSSKRAKVREEKELRELARRGRRTPAGDAAVREMEGRR